MSAHADILDQREPLGKSFLGSLALHGSLAAAVLAYSWAGIASRQPFMGDPHGGGMGAVTVNAVPSIKLPSRSGPTNPVANDTESAAPEAPPAKVKPQPKVKEPPPDAIPIKSRNAARKTALKPVPYSPPNKWRAQQKDLPNQVYSSTGQAMVSPLIGMTGGGGVGIGNDSPFGQQFGAYAKLLRDKVANAWRTSDVDPRRQTAPPVVVTFSIRRDGSLAPGSLKVVQSSGIAPLDISAQRAIMDATPFNALPAEFQRNQADIELRFELRR